MKKISTLLLAAVVFSVASVASALSTNAYNNTDPGAYHDQYGNQLVKVVQYACLTFTAVNGEAATGVTIVAAIANKTISVVGWSVSTNTAGEILVHHQGGAAVRSNTASNIFGGGWFGANGGERGCVATYCPGLAVSQPVCADFSNFSGNVEIIVAYFAF